tara:strand:- start:7373 stop:8083 length:711 start_codon:yes stop_codon:yes gene_type:complete
MKINNPKLFFIEDLAKYGLLNQFIKTKLLEKRLMNIILTEEESLNAKLEYRKINKIDSEKDLNAFMKKKLYTENSLKYNIELPVKIYKYCQHKFKNKVYSEYLRRKAIFDIATYSLIRVEKEIEAKEFFLQISECEKTFAEIASKYSLGHEKNSQGILGPVQMNRIHPLLQEKIKEYKNGELSMPFRIENNWFLIRIENFQESNLNEQIEKEIFMQLLEESILKEASNVDLKTIFN